MLAFTGKVLSGLSLGMISSFLLGASSVGLWTFTWPLIILTGAVGIACLIIAQQSPGTGGAGAAATSTGAPPPPYDGSGAVPTAVPVSQKTPSFFSFPFFSFPFFSFQSPTRVVSKTYRSGPIPSSNRNVGTQQVPVASSIVLPSASAPSVTHIGTRSYRVH